MAPSKLPKEVFPKDGRYGWLIQPTAFTFMRYDYNLMQQKIYAAIIDKLQTAFQDECNNAVKHMYPENRLLYQNSWREYEMDFPNDQEMEWDKKTMAIPVKIKAKDFNVRPNQYAELRDSFVNFGNSPVGIEVQGSHGVWIEYSCLCRMRVPKDLKRFTHVYAVFDRKVAVAMLHATRASYTKFLKQVISFSQSKYTSRFYLFLSAFRNKSMFYVPYEDLRLYLRLNVKYKDYHDFTHDVLDIVQSELKSMFDCGLSNLYFSYKTNFDKEESCLNRKAIGVTFNIYSEPDTPDIIETPAVDTLQKKSIYDHLILYCGCSEENAISIASKITNSELYKKAVDIIFRLDRKFKSEFYTISNKEAYTLKSFENCFPGVIESKVVGK